MNAQIANAERIAKALIKERGREDALNYAKGKYRSFHAIAKRTNNWQDEMMAISWVRVINAIEPIVK